MILSAVFLSLISANTPTATTIPKDEFHFSNAAEPETIDPARASGVPDATILQQLFEGLMGRKADWVTMFPSLAESYKLSADKKTYTFKLRPNLKWSDGSPLTASDFEYSWLRAINKNTTAEYGEWLISTLVGGEEYNKNSTPENAKKVGVKAINPQTLEVKLKSPVPTFLNYLAEPLTYPVKKEVVEKWGDQWTRPEHIVGSGAYILKEWKPQDKIVMEKNPNFYDAAKVQIKKIVAFPIGDRQTAVNLFKDGKLDWSGTNGAPNSLVDSYKQDSNFRVWQSATVYFYRFNVTKAPFNDLRVRQALALGIDRAQITGKVTRGGETPQPYFVPKGLGGYTPAKAQVSDNQEENLAKARKLLADAGFPNGKGFPKTSILYNTDDNHKKIALAIQQMWKKNLGIDVGLDNQEWKVYLKNQKALSYDISRSAWAADYPDAGTFLEMFTSGSLNNNTGWKNKDYDKYYSEANITMDAKKRNMLLQKAEDILMAEMPITPIYLYADFGFVRPELLGKENNPVDRIYVKYLSKK